MNEAATETPTTTAEPQLHHLELHSDRYASTENSRFYAFRGGDGPTWTLIARDGEFRPMNCPSAQACDAALDVWLATR